MLYLPTASDVAEGQHNFIIQRTDSDLLWPKADIIF
jgi:hypothetical protein